MSDSRSMIDIMFECSANAKPQYSDLEKWNLELKSNFIENICTKCKNLSVCSKEFNEKNFVGCKSVKFEEERKSKIKYYAIEEIPEIMGSGSQVIGTKYFETEEEVMAFIAENKNYEAKRTIYEATKKTQWYDVYLKRWRD